MAELDIGQHCTQSHCKQLDFLPIKCDGCLKIFCKEHSTLDAHNCSQSHLDKEKPEFTGPKSHACCFSSCTNRELTPIICEACSLNFCLAHRHQVDHSCEKYEPPKERMAKTSKHVQKILDSKQPAAKPQRKPRSDKSKATAAKVALMKIKMKAVGDKGIPETERVYLSVCLPQTSKERSKPMFFSDKWTIGRIVDKIATVASLQNDNNVGGAKKLRLFDWDDGCMLQIDCSLGGVMSQHGLCNGGSVICEYVEDGVETLTNLDTYN